MKKDFNFAFIQTVGFFVIGIIFMEVVTLLISLIPEYKEMRNEITLRVLIYSFGAYATGTFHFLFIKLALKLGRPKKFNWLFFTLPPIMLRSIITLLIIDCLEKWDIEKAKVYFQRTIEHQKSYNLDEVKPVEALKQKDFKEFFLRCIAYLYLGSINLIEKVKNMPHGHSDPFIMMIAYYLKRRDIDAPLKRMYLEFILDHINESSHFNTEQERIRPFTTVAQTAAVLPLKEAQKILHRLPAPDPRQILYASLVKEHFMRKDFLFDALENIKSQKMLSDTLASLMHRLTEIKDSDLDTEEKKIFTEVRKHILMTAKDHLLNWDEFSFVQK